MCANMCKMDAKKICKSFKKLITVLDRITVILVACIWSELTLVAGSE